MALVAPSIAALAIGWVALLVSAPQLPIPLAGVLYVFGSVICHQIAERSFHIDGAQLPVCARCLGLYAGFAAGALAATLSRLVRGSDPGVRPRGLTPLAVAASPTVITVGLEWMGAWHPSNALRALAGVPLGVAVAVVVIRALRARPALHYDTCLRPRPAASSRPAPHI